jgi:nucleoside-diphosphate-sugar epimerase
MHVLVTGASGFIGQHLVRALLDAGHQVRGMYNTERPLYFFKKDEIEWHRADLRDAVSLGGCARGIDVVYHLAGISRNDSRRNWDDYEAENITGTALMLEESGKSGVKRFVYTSTVEAAGFGDGVHPRLETEPCRPGNHYGTSKLKAEGLVLGKIPGMSRTVLRLPMIYGPGTFLIVPKLFGFVKRGFYPLIGAGQGRMEFCFVGNAVAALLVAGIHPKAAGELFYVSDERSYTIKEVITHIAEAMHIKIRFIYLPVFTAECAALCFEAGAKIFPVSPFISPYSHKPFFSRETVRWTTGNYNTVDTGKIRSLLGYAPGIPIAQGCKITADWLAAHWDQQHLQV